MYYILLLFHTIVDWMKTKTAIKLLNRHFPHAYCESHTMGNSFFLPLWFRFSDTTAERGTKYNPVLVVSVCLSVGRAMWYGEWSSSGAMIRVIKTKINKRSESSRIRHKHSHCSAIIPFFSMARGRQGSGEGRFGCLLFLAIYPCHPCRFVLCGSGGRFLFYSTVF